VVEIIDVRYNKEEAIDMAVNRCIEENVLRDFLVKYGKEVRGMIYEDITLERFLEIRGEEKFEQGNVVGETRMTVLYRTLKAKGRLEDYDRAMEDQAFRRQLFQEFSL